MENISVPKPESDRTRGPVHYLRLAATALTIGASALGLAAQVTDHFRKPKAGAGQRTKAETALLGLSVLRALPGLIRSVKTLTADIKK
ncbi:MAG TPA: hypothetical protein VG815_11825 [Chloroflexota bacterium]|jgi:hypothetical protein|nr:hypothetical protein [Chloroflexota bacterium]